MTTEAAMTALHIGAAILVLGILTSLGMHVYVGIKWWRVAREWEALADELRAWPKKPARDRKDFAGDGGKEKR